MNILALEKEVPGITDDQFIPELLRQEAVKTWELYQSGIIRELYFRQDWHGAVLMLECTDNAEARSILGTLPLVRDKLIDFEIIPLGPYTGFSRLFSPQPHQ